MNVIDDKARFKRWDFWVHVDQTSTNGAGQFDVPWPGSLTPPDLGAYWCTLSADPPGALARRGGLGPWPRPLLSKIHLVIVSVDCGNLGRCDLLRFFFHKPLWSSLIWHPIARRRRRRRRRWWWWKRRIIAGGAWGHNTTTSNIGINSQLHPLSQEAYKSRNHGCKP